MAAALDQIKFPAKPQNFTQRRKEAKTQRRKAAKKREIENDPRREKRFICLMIYFFVILSFYQRD